MCVLALPGDVLSLAGDVLSLDVLSLPGDVLSLAVVVNGSGCGFNSSKILQYRLSDAVGT